MTQCPRCSAILPSSGERFCPNCGAALPPPPLPAAQPGGPESASTPWERRGELGFVPALVETTKQVLFGSAEFFRRMPTEAGIGAPLGYAMLVGYFGVVVVAIYQAVMRVALGSTLYELGRQGPLGRIAPFLEGGVGLVSQIVLGPFFLLIGLFLGAGIYHLLLLLLGGAKRGFEATFRVVCYAQAADILCVVPFCGSVIGFFWGLAVLIIGLAEAHRIGRGTAALAVLLPILLLCCCCGLAAALFFGGLATALSHAR